ncbi:MAG: putative beta-lysine N-acetyltransferase [Bacillota bacterium]|nr:putative beta-lysine N-acetyltransferase [Bacillota bacterium]MDW7684729.1 putative beta-lysine N-acetyltransferase [Bacillota bacterium]
MLSSKKGQKRERAYSLQREGNNVSAKLLVDPYNSRVKLQSFSGEPEGAANALLLEAKEHGFGKVIAFAREKDRAAFGSVLCEEGKIPGFYAGEDAYCMVAYPDSERALPRDQHKADDIVRLAKEKAAGKSTVAEGFTFRRATPDDVRALTAHYTEIFGTSYPTPVFDSDYLRRAVAGDNVFWLAFSEGELCGAASLDIDKKNKNAEVTDCAVRPEYRGRGLLAALIGCLADDAPREGVECLYSFSRALLPGINIVLSAGGFAYYGRMVNNCVICGNFEDMNIWQKFVTC